MHSYFSMLRVVLVGGGLLGIVSAGCGKEFNHCAETLTCPLVSAGGMQGSHSAGGGATGIGGARGEMMSGGVPGLAGAGGGQSVGGASVQGGGTSAGGAPLEVGGGSGGTLAGGTVGSGGTLAGGTGGTNSPGGAAAYNPCPPAGTPCRIMPLGFGIVQGYGSSLEGGFRVILFRKVLAAQHTITFVGSASHGPVEVDHPLKVPPEPFPKSHEGHPGLTITGLLADITDNSRLSANIPDIVLLHVSTSAAQELIGPGLSALASLIDKVVADAPQALLVVAIPIPNDLASQNGVATYNAGIRDLVEARALAGKHVAAVDMNTPFLQTSNWKTELLADEAHPNDTGYEIMADVWYQAIGSLLR